MWTSAEWELEKCTFRPEKFVKSRKYINSSSKVRDQTWNKFDLKLYESASEMFKTGNDAVEESILNWSKISNWVGGESEILSLGVRWDMS